MKDSEMPTEETERESISERQLTCLELLPQIFFLLLIILIISVAIYDRQIILDTFSLFIDWVTPFHFIPFSFVGEGKPPLSELGDCAPLHYDDFAGNAYSLPDYCTRIRFFETV